MLTLTSLYEKSWDGTYRLVPTPVLPANSIPSYWPEVTEPFLCGQKITVSNPPPVVPPKTPPGGLPSSWINVYETGQQGQRIIVGRVPSYTEFWEGNPPTDLKPELRLSEVDEYLSKLSGLASPAGSLRKLISTPVNQSFTPFPVPPKTIGIGGLGGFPIEDPNSPRTKESDYLGKRINQGDAPISRSSPIGNCWEQICCIGLDVEKKEVTAVIQILQTIGYGGSLCDSTGFEGVGFWLVEPSIVEYVPNDWPSSPVNNPIPREGFCAASVRFIGSTKIPVADIPRNTNAIEGCLDSVHQYDARSLLYTASVPLSEEDLDFMLHCSAKSPRLPILHVVMGWNTEIYNEHYGGMKHQFWDNHSVVVQYPVAKLKQIRKECAVGILWEGCPRVLFSSVVRRATNPTTGKSIIDKLAIAITPAIVEQTRNHGGVMFCVLKGDANLRMQRTGILNQTAVVTRSNHYKISDLPNDRVITPFDLDNGNWMICAVFGPMKDPIEWDPARDMILTGNISTEVITCVGTVDSFAIPGIEMAGPEVVVLGELTFRKEDSQVHYNYPPCLPNAEARASRDLSISSHEMDVYYPVRAGKLHSVANLAVTNHPTPIIILSPANGAYDYRGRQHDYRSIVSLMVKQGCIVVILAHNGNGGSYYVADNLATVLQELHRVFNKINSHAPLFFMGHSNGGGQVARALTSETYKAPPDGIRQVSASTLKRIKGGMMLAPTVYGGDLHLDIAPFLVIYGALDSQGAFVRHLCKDGTYSDYIASPVRYYTKGESNWQALVLVDGGTHFRWIDYDKKDDFEESNNYEVQLVQDLVLDGPDLKHDRDHPEHKSIFHSFTNYILRVTVLEDSNIKELFFNPALLSPDILVLGNAKRVASQLHTLARVNSNRSLNALGKVPFANLRFIVERRILCDGVECDDNALTIAPVSFVNTTTYPIMDSYLVMCRGESLQFNFSLKKPFNANPSDVLRFTYSVFDSQFGKAPLDYTLKCSFNSASTGPVTVPILEFMKTRANIVLPEQVTVGSGSHRSYYGIMNTVEEIHVPLSWLWQQCYSQKLNDGVPVLMDISISCEFRESAIFGLGQVQVVSLDSMKVVLP